MDKNLKPEKQGMKGDDHSIEIDGINYPVHEEVWQLYESLHLEKELLRNTLIEFKANIEATLDEI